jgi:hypothetical protein
MCYSPSCDWAIYIPGCDDRREAFKRCPVFDVIAYQSLSQTPGLVYLQQGKGFTVPQRLFEGGPSFDEYQGLGRCVDAVCRSDPPPGNSSGLEAGDTWCDTVINDNGQVLQQKAYIQSCPCNDLGKAWGVCSSKPRLPNLGMDYDVDVLTRLGSLSISEVLNEYEGCGSIPLTVRNNRAGRNGGGIFQDGCDSGLRTRSQSGTELGRGSCWVGGISAETNAAFIFVFEDNESDGAGGAIFTKCHQLGGCSSIDKMRVGLPAPDPKILSFRGNNRASGYGNTIASAPNELVLADSIDKEYVPGQTPFDFTISMLDARGQTVQGSPSKPHVTMSQTIQVWLMRL